MRRAACIGLLLLSFGRGAVVADTSDTAKLAEAASTTDVDPTATAEAGGDPSSPASSVSKTAKNAAAAPAPAPERGPSAAELSERLIYSVDRVPERTFETARAAEVITASDLWRKNGMTLADVLQHEAGIVVTNYNAAGGVPVIRGLHGKQVMVMIDGIKVNDTMWRSSSKDYLGIVPLSEVERIEIVRGVVSVLGTESLGGVINIITKKGPPGDEGLGGTIGLRYTSANQAFTTPLELYGGTDKLRWVAGGEYLDVANNEGGGEIGEQARTSYEHQAFYGTLQYFVSADKTLTASYRNATDRDMQRAWQVAEGTNTWYNDGPAELTLASISYQDLTERWFEDSLRVTGYFNRQSDARDEIRRATPSTQNFASEVDDMGGLSLELGKFVGSSHHLLYGVDASSETIDSRGSNLNLVTGEETVVRGRYTDGAQYRTLGVYLQDRFQVAGRLTATVGARYGVFDAQGEEDSSVGVISLENRKSDVTGAINLVYHATPSLNLIANAMRGFRAPSIDDLSRFSVRNTGTDVPNPDASSEHVDSYELGAKYESSKFSTSVFFYRNDFTDLLVRQPGTFNGLPYLDQNGNGTRDAREPDIFQLQNVGTARIEGYEGSFRYAPTVSMVITGNVTKTTGTDTLTDEPLERIPPLFGNLTLGLFGHSSRRYWAQAVFNFAASQDRLSSSDVSNYRIGPGGTEGYSVLSVRGGATFADRVRFTIGIDNLGDKAYKTHDSFVYRPGRQLVIGTEYRF
jgi:outer membrane receptor protein involved in Fe transport